jgi:hypothetical protein
VQALHIVHTHKPYSQYPTLSLITTIVDIFRVLVEEARAGQPKLMNVGLHCRCARPAHVAAVSDFLDYAKSYGREVWICTREEISDFWAQFHYPRGAGSPVKSISSESMLDRKASGTIDTADDASEKMEAVNLSEVTNEDGKKGEEDGDVI